MSCINSRFSCVLSPQRARRGAADAVALPARERSPVGVANRTASHARTNRHSPRDRAVRSRSSARCSTDRSSRRARRVLKRAVPHTLFHPPVRADHHIVDRSHEREQPDVLKRSRDAQLGDPVGWKPAIETPSRRDCSRGDREKPGDAVECRRLARAVGPDHRQDLALVEAEADVRHGEKAAESLGHAVELEECHSGDSLHRGERFGLSVLSSSMRRARLGSSPPGRNSIIRMSAMP